MNGARFIAPVDEGKAVTVDARAIASAFVSFISKASFTRKKDGVKVVMEVVVLATVEGILVGAVVAVVGSVSSVSLGYALSCALFRDIAGEMASEASVLVLREVVATSPASLCKILHLSSWAVCSNLRLNPTNFIIPHWIKLLTRHLLSRAAPLAGESAKDFDAALALGVRRDAFISTAPLGRAIAAIPGSALSSEEEENEEETFFDQIHPLCDRVMILSNS